MASYFYCHIWVNLNTNRKMKCTEMASWGGGAGKGRVVLEVSFILAARKTILSNFYSPDVQSTVFILPSWL